MTKKPYSTSLKRAPKDRVVAVAAPARHTEPIAVDVPRANPDTVVDGLAASKGSRARIIAAFWFIVIVYGLSIDLKSIWTDEGFRYSLLAGGQTWRQFIESGSFGSFSQVIHAVRYSSQYFPLFYLVDNAIIRLTGSHSDVLLRTVNLMWLVVSLQGLLRFFRKYTESTRLFAMVVFGLNGFVLMHVLQIREYPLYLALQIWSSCLLFELLELPADVPLRRTWPTLVAYGILMGLFFYTQPYAVFTLVAQAIMVLTRNKGRLAFLGQIAISYVIAGAIMAPWIIVRTRDYVVGRWDARPQTLALLLESLRIGFGSVLIYQSWTGHPLLQVFVVTVVGGITVAWILGAQAKTSLDRRAIYGLLTGVCFFGFQVAYFFLNQALSVWPRYFVAYSFSYVVLSTCAFSFFQQLASGRKQWYWHALAPAILVFVCAVGLDQVRLYRSDPYMDTGMSAHCNWRVTAEAMRHYVGPDDVVFDYNPLFSWTVNARYPLFPNELSYNDIGAVSPAGKPVLWVLDTGVVPANTQHALDQLRAAKYSVTSSPDLGCQCRLFKLELAPASAANVPLHKQ